MPGSIPGIGGATGAGLSATTASVVNNNAETDAAFCNAERVTFVGSTIPDFNHVYPFICSGIVSNPFFLQISNEQQ